MTKEEVLKVVTHSGDCYRFKLLNDSEKFNFYVSEITDFGLWQDAKDLPLEFLPFDSIESAESY